MKSNTKSSITLPASELAMVNDLMKKLKAKSKVDVVRQALQLLKQTTDRSELAEEFRRASLLNREDAEELIELFEGVDDHLIPPYDEDESGN